VSEIDNVTAQALQEIWERTEELGLKTFTNNRHCLRGRDVLRQRVPE